MAALRDLSVIADWASPALCASSSAHDDASEEHGRAAAIESDFSSANG
jgi:hypothetical protein